MPPRPLALRIWSALAPTLRYWMQTEVHVFAFSIAANVLLSFFPFLIVCVSIGNLGFDLLPAIDLALKDLFPSEMQDFVSRNLRTVPSELGLLSILILLFSANGIFEPLEVALNHVWGIHKNRSFVRNQLVSLGLIFVCGSLALLSLAIAAIRLGGTANAVERVVAAAFYKAAAVPLTVLVLYLIYRYLPNGRPPVKRVLPAAIVVGVLLEVLKTINAVVWPWLLEPKLSREYGVFYHSATLIFISFLTSMLVLGGAEWASRGHRMDQELDKAAAK